MTLREALNTVDFRVVFQFINEKDQLTPVTSDRPSIDNTTIVYSRVVKELLSKPSTKPYKYSWIVEETVNPEDGSKFAETYLLNPKYVPPPKGAKPWGGKNPPKGHYNCNLVKYNKLFACMFLPWSTLIDTQITYHKNISLEKAVAEILWELTFYGWTEEQCNKKCAEVEESMDLALKEIKDGKCIELPPKEGDKFKVIVPDSVSKQLIDESNRIAKKRK